MLLRFWRSLRNKYKVAKEHVEVQALGCGHGRADPVDVFTARGSQLDFVAALMQKKTKAWFGGCASLRY